MHGELAKFLLPELMCCACLKVATTDLQDFLVEKGLSQWIRICSSKVWFPLQNLVIVRNLCDPGVNSPPYGPTVVSQLQLVAPCWTWAMLRPCTVVTVARLLSGAQVASGNGMGLELICWTRSVKILIKTGISTILGRLSLWHFQIQLNVFASLSKPANKCLTVAIYINQ